MKYKDYLKLGLVGLATVTALCVGCANVDASTPTSPLYPTPTVSVDATENTQTGSQTPLSGEDGEDITESVAVPQEGSQEVTGIGLSVDEGYSDDAEVASLLPVSVVRVVDGDTYYVNMDGQEVKVRLIGVDTPESVAPQSYTDATGKENTEVGEYISEIMKDVIKEGDTLLLEFDVDMYDKYDRVLAYAYFEDGEMVQDFLLSNGLAQTMTITPNVKYSDHFADVQRVAVENGIGIWNYDIPTITKESLQANLTRGSGFDR